MELNNPATDLGNLEVKNKHYIWEPFMRKYDCQYICEIGVELGINFQEFIKHQPKLAVAVDIWKVDTIKSRNDSGYSQKELDNNYESFRETMKDKPFVKIIREYSFDAVKQFENNFFDLLYIDADHSFEGCYRDLRDWYPKVKPGRFLLGDDYRQYLTKKTGIRFGVIEAVNRFARENNLTIIELPRFGWGIIKPIN